MRLEFDATLDDIAEAALRLQSKSRALRAWRRNGAALTGLLMGLFVFLVSPPPLWWRLLWAGLGVVLGAASYLLVSRRGNRKRRIRRYLRELLGTGGPVKVQVELSESGVWTKQGDMQFIFEWPSVTAVEENPDCIELVAQGGLVLLRNERFESPDARTRFVECARKYLELAREPGRRATP